MYLNYRLLSNICNNTMTSIDLHLSVHVKDRIFYSVIVDFIPFRKKKLVPSLESRSKINLSLFDLCIAAAILVNLVLTAIISIKSFVYVTPKNFANRSISILESCHNQRTKCLLNLYKL